MMDESFHLTSLDVRRFDFGRSLRGYDPAKVEQELDALDRSRRTYLAQMRVLLARQLSEVEASEQGRQRGDGEGEATR